MATASKSSAKKPTKQQPVTSGELADSKPIESDRQSDRQMVGTNSGFHWLLLEEIEPNPYQPRKEFSIEELTDLADSMDDVLITPIVVRSTDKPDHYEIIDGERRYRAAKLRNWKKIPAIVREGITDQMMATMAIDANDQRKDLNPIERANAYQMLTLPVSKGGLGMTQKQVADRFHCTQGQVSNVIRLLKLPGIWQQRVISGEISGREVRSLLTWLDYDGVMEEIERQYGEGRDFATDLENAIETATRPMHGSYYSEVLSRTTTVLSMAETDAELESINKALALVAIGFRDEAGTVPDFRATNVTLWEELQAKARERLANSDEPEAAETVEDSSGEDSADDSEVEQETDTDLADAGGDESAENEPRDILKPINAWLRGVLPRLVEFLLGTDGAWSVDFRSVLARESLDAFWREGLGETGYSDFLRRLTIEELEAVGADYGLFIKPNSAKTKIVNLIATSPHTKTRMPLLLDAHLPQTGEPAKGKRGRPKKTK